jgi:hypothetical protein
VALGWWPPSSDIFTLRPNGTIEGRQSRAALLHCLSSRDFIGFGLLNNKIIKIDNIKKGRKNKRKANSAAFALLVFSE